MPKHETKFSPEYRVFLSSLVVNCMQKEAAAAKDDDVMRHATTIAKQHLNAETDNAQRALKRAAAGQP